MQRLIVCNRFDAQLFELSENDVFELERHEVINGEHALTITTTRVLEKGWRIVTQDARSKVREYVVNGVDAKHAAGDRPIGTYYCVWSVQPDLMGVRVSRQPGIETPVTAGVALEAALSTTTRWNVGTVTNTKTGGASMYDTDAWDALKTLIAKWGGEVDTTINTSSQGITGRLVDLYSQQGEQTAKRRFDFGADLTSVRRVMDDNPLYCRLTPRGKGEQTEGGGYGRKITIESVNGGLDYLTYTPMVDLAKLPNGSGGWEYPTLEVENSDCETPADLKAWAQSVLADYLTPKVTYEVDVIQAAKEGVDMHGVSLGDAVHIVDAKFDGLRISGRIVEMTVDELNERNVRVVIGSISESITSKFQSVSSSLSAIENRVTDLQNSLSTADYIESLLDRINAEINANGGYTYITDGQGLRTYDRAVSDPLVGAEASKVVELKGGSIRIADSKTSSGEWEWKTVFVSGHILADLVTAAKLTTGYIGSAESGSYWDLDNGDLQMTGNFISTAEYDYTVIGGERRYSHVKTALGTYYIKNPLDSTSWIQRGTYTGFGFTYEPAEGTSESSHRVFLAPITPSNKDRAALIASDQLVIGTGTNQADFFSEMVLGRTTTSLRSLNKTEQRGWLVRAGHGPDSGASSNPNSLYIGVTRPNYSDAGVIRVDASDTSSQAPLWVVVKGGCRMNGDFSVGGTKNRLVETDDYGERLLYCYETPAPMFGDIGSGTIGEDGLCTVSIDDMLSEAARFDCAYQVFIQKCGDGDCWVSEKSPTHFTVQGTPGLAFDWEAKAHQLGYETARLESSRLYEELEDRSGIPFPTTAYGDYVTEMEQLYSSETEA